MDSNLTESFIEIATLEDKVFESAWNDTAKLPWESIILDCPAVIYTFGIVSSIGIILTITTLIIIGSHHRLRKRSNIFPFNIVLADCMWDCALFTANILILSKVYSQVPVPTWVLYIIMPLVILPSTLVSNASILLVAVDQFIAFKIDPFGAKNILTKSRRIIICLLTWVISMVVLTPLYIVQLYHNPTIVFLRIYLCNIFIVLTVIGYYLVYRTICRSSLGTNLQLQERRKRNRRVLRTYALVLGSTLILYTLPDLIYVVFYRVKGHLHACRHFDWAIIHALNPIANTLIYWWRLKEFREIFSTTR